MKRIILPVLVSLAAGCQSNGFTQEETQLINNADSILRVLTIESPADLEILRSPCTDLPDEALFSDEFTKLSELMLATVTHPSQDGVGIAGPQIGLNRRVIAVQRFDKPGEPFEIYPNIRIVWTSESLAVGSEGCLSVPERSGDVARSTEVEIEYTALPGEREKGEPLRKVRERISGFTAVIFQHEVDHLEGTLYIDKCVNPTQTHELHYDKILLDAFYYNTPYKSSDPHLITNGRVEIITAEEFDIENYEEWVYSTWENIKEEDEAPGRYSALPIPYLEQGQICVYDENNIKVLEAFTSKGDLTSYTIYEDGKPLVELSGKIEAHYFEGTPVAYFLVTSE